MLKPDQTHFRSAKWSSEVFKCIRRASGTTGHDAKCPIHVPEWFRSLTCGGTLSTGLISFDRLISHEVIKKLS
jgi:hypothetical protein